MRTLKQKKKTVKLLGVKLDNKLNFDPHISDLCKKAATQLNVLKRLEQFIGFEERKHLFKVSFFLTLITVL